MKRVWFLIFAVCLMLSSCVKDIVLDAGEEPKVVVECLLTEDPVQELYLSYTKGVSQAEADLLPEAEARLVDLDEYNFSVPFSPAGDGRWVLDYAALSGHRYRLEVKVPGHDLITAETKMPDEFVSSNTFHHPLTGNIPLELYKDISIGYSICNLFCNFPEYCWIYFINEDGSLAESICTDFPGVDDFNLTGDIYIPEKGEKKPVYEGEELTDEGIVSVWGEERDSFLYPALAGRGLHDRFLRIPKGEKLVFPWEDDHIPTDKERLTLLNKSYMISGNFKVSTGKTGTIVIEYLSDEYDKYMAAAMRSSQFEASTEISKIYLNENIIESNVQGGLGIFGAKVQRRYDWRKVYSNIDYPMS